MKAALLAVLVANGAAGAPVVVSDPWTTGTRPTHCGLLIDAKAKVDVPVVLDAAGNPFCQFDISAVTVGAHRIKATAVLIDQTWGRQESDESLPLDFSRPAAPSVPSGLLIRVR
jgi:hypothetical protein